MLKLEAYRNEVLFSIVSWCVSSIFSVHPVVPLTTGVLLFRAVVMLSKAELGVLKSIATSAFVKSIE